jgi:pimeloyl-ACP methyl ester carboxylesterase
MNWAGRTKPFVDPRGMPLPNSVAEARYLLIGGVKQWVMVRGRDVGNPLLVIVHGGPGSSETALFRTSNAALEEAFTVVYWDQRGAGRSLSSPRESMTIARYVADLDELIDTLLARFGHRRVIVLGHSWGSAVGTLYATGAPAKVAAYVGVGQISNMLASETLSYRFALSEARRRGHRKAVRVLEAMGEPPLSVEAVMQQRRWLMTFGGAFGSRVSFGRLLRRTMFAPEGSPLDVVRLARGARASIDALWDQMAPLRLDRDHRFFDVPVFFLLGRLDNQVVASLAAQYFEVIDAPHKELVWFEESGHFLPFEEPAKFNATLVDRVRPFALGERR